MTIGDDDELSRLYVILSLANNYLRQLTQTQS